MLFRKKNIPKCIIDDMEISSDSDRGNSDSEIYYEKIFDEGNLKNTNITHI